MSAKARTGLLTQKNIEECVSRAGILAKNHAHSPRLCPGLSPLLKREDILAKAAKFDELFDFCLKPENSTMELYESQLEVIETVLCDFELFPYILTFSNKIHYQFTDIDLDEDILYRLFTFTMTHAHSFAKFKPKFLGMIECLLNPQICSPSTRFHLRALVLCFCFPVFFDDLEQNSCFYQLLFHIVDLEAKEGLFFWSIMGALPNLLNRIVKELIEQIDFYLFDKTQILGDEFQFFTVFGTFLQRAFDIRMNNPEIFQSRKLSTLLNPQFMAQSLSSPINNIIHHPVILTREFKMEVFNIIIERVREKQIEKANIIYESQSQSEFPNSITVERKNITDSLFFGIQHLDKQFLLVPFTVTFDGEEGQDDGGLTREFFYKLTGVAFGPDYGMFRFVNSKFYWFCSFSDVEIGVFRILGTVVGLSIVNSVQMPIRFPLLMYKKLLGKTLVLEDIEEVDPYFVSGVKKMKQMKKDGSNVEDVGLYFTTTVDQYGSLVDVPIVEGGETISVTNENLDQYIDLYVQWITETSIGNKFKSFAEGIKNVIPDKLIHLFTPQDLDQIVSGNPVFDWSAFQIAAKYVGYSEKSRPVKLFWDVFNNDFSNDDKRALLKFTTGCDYSPIGGLGTVEFIIQKSTLIENLPEAHTCSSTLVLPAYTTRQKMKSSMEIIIQHTEGFGFK